MKRGTINLIFIAVIILVVGYFLRDIKPQEVYLLIKEINSFYFLLAFVSCLLTILLWNLRFLISLRGLINISYLKLFPVLLAGIFVNQITPGAGTGGEPVRAYFLNKKYKKPKSKILGCIFADKFFNLVVFIFFVVFSIFFVLIFLKISSIAKIILLIFLLIIFSCAFLFVKFLFGKSKINFGWLIRIIFSFRNIRKKFKTQKNFENYFHKRIEHFSLLFKKVFLHKRTFYISMLISLTIWILNFLTSYFLFLSIGVHINFLWIIIVVSLGQFIGEISLFPGGIGLIEGMTFLLYSAFGIIQPFALIVAFLSRIIFYFFSLLIGGICLAYLNHKIK